MISQQVIAVILCYAYSSVALQLPVPSSEAASGTPGLPSGSRTNAPVHKLGPKGSRTNAPGHKLGPKNAAEAWNVLYNVFQSEKTFASMMCSSEGYYDYFSRLSDLDLSSLRLPPNMRILSYGNSFTGELLQNILAANEDVLIKDGPFGGLEGKRLDFFPGDKTDGYLVQWDFVMNTTIIGVGNYLPLQDADSVDTLKQFMRDYHFDIGFYTNPDPKCMLQNCTSEFPNYGSNLCECVCDKRKTSLFTCDQKYKGAFRGGRRDVEPLWNAIHESLQENLYEVESWTNEPRTWFHTGSGHIIHTYDMLSGYPCNTDDMCSRGSEVKGHQCQPGVLAYISQGLVAKMAEVYFRKFGLK